MKHLPLLILLAACGAEPEPDGCTGCEGLCIERLESIKFDYPNGGQCFDTCDATAQCREDEACIVYRPEDQGVCMFACTTDEECAADEYCSICIGTLEECAAGEGSRVCMPTGEVPSADS